MHNISVIVCTYNPNYTVFQRCLNSITEAAKLFPPKEIIIIDNNSDSPLQNHAIVQEYIRTNPIAKLVTETQQGLTPARLRGITESTGDLILFVDDDNFIRNDFLEAGAAIAAKYPMIGSFSGQVDLEFEARPEDWTKRYWGLLVYRLLDESRWSNLLNNGETMPCGAGLFVRRNVAEHYLQLHESGRRTLKMDRSGNSLMSGGDNDLALCACDIGLGVGVFKELFLFHYIPRKRLELKYLLNLAEAISASAVILNSFRGIETSPRNSAARIKDLIRYVVKNSIARKFHLAVLNGEKKGREILKNEQPIKQNA